MKPQEKEKPKEKEKPREKEAPKSNTTNTNTAAQDKERADRLAKMRAAASNESGSGGTTGTGVGSGGTAPPGYTDRVRRKVKPLIVFNPSQISGNPAVSVNVELAPDGNILSKKITKSSGNDDWDNAVIKALERAESLPKDEDGKVPRQVILIFKPKD